MSKIVNFQHSTTGYVFYQAPTEDGIAEPAISIREYGDVICLDSESGSINLNYESIADFIKILKGIKKKRDEPKASN